MAQHPRRPAILWALLALAVVAAAAPHGCLGQTYTATTSGVWSNTQNTVTWVPSVPPIACGSCTIVVRDGVNLTVDSVNATQFVVGTGGIGAALWLVNTPYLGEHVTGTAVITTAATGSCEFGVPADPMSGSQSVALMLSGADIALDVSRALQGATIMGVQVLATAARTNTHLTCAGLLKFSAAQPIVLGALHTAWFAPISGRTCTVAGTMTFVAQAAACADGDCRVSLVGLQQAPDPPSPAPKNGIVVRESITLMSSSVAGALTLTGSGIVETPLSVTGSLTMQIGAPGPRSAVLRLTAGGANVTVTGTLQVIGVLQFDDAGINLLLAGPLVTAGPTVFSVSAGCSVVLTTPQLTATHAQAELQSQSQSQSQLLAAAAGLSDGVLPSSAASLTVLCTPAAGQTSCVLDASAPGQPLQPFVSYAFSGTATGSSQLQVYLPDTGLALSTGASISIGSGVVFPQAATMLSTTYGSIVTFASGSMLTAALSITGQGTVQFAGGSTIVAPLQVGQLSQELQIIGPSNGQLSLIGTGLVVLKGMVWSSVVAVAAGVQLDGRSLVPTATATLLSSGGSITLRESSVLQGSITCTAQCAVTLAGPGLSTVADGSSLLIGSQVAVANPVTCAFAGALFIPSGSSATVLPGVMFSSNATAFTGSGTLNLYAATFSSVIDTRQQPCVAATLMVFGPPAGSTLTLSYSALHLPQLLGVGGTLNVLDSALTILGVLECALAPSLPSIATTAESSSNFVVSILSGSLTVLSLPSYGVNPSGVTTSVLQGTFSFYSYANVLPLALSGVVPNGAVLYVSHPGVAIQPIPPPVQLNVTVFGALILTNVLVAEEQLNGITVPLSFLNVVNAPNPPSVQLTGYAMWVLLVDGSGVLAPARRDLGQLMYSQNSQFIITTPDEGDGPDGIPSECAVVTLLELLAADTTVTLRTAPGVSVQSNGTSLDGTVVLGVNYVSRSAQCPALLSAAAIGVGDAAGNTGSALQPPFPGTAIFWTNSATHMTPGQPVEALLLVPMVQATGGDVWLQLGISIAANTVFQSVNPNQPAPPNFALNGCTVYANVSFAATPPLSSGVWLFGPTDGTTTTLHVPAVIPLMTQWAGTLQIVGDGVLQFLQAGPQYTSMLDIGANAVLTSANAPGSDAVVRVSGVIQSAPCHTQQTSLTISNVVFVDTAAGPDPFNIVCSTCNLDPAPDSPCDALLQQNGAAPQLQLRLTNVSIADGSQLWLYSTTLVANPSISAPAGTLLLSGTVFGPADLTRVRTVGAIGPAQGSAVQLAFAGPVISIATFQASGAVIVLSGQTSVVVDTWLGAWHDNTALNSVTIGGNSQLVIAPVVPVGPPTAVATSVLAGVFTLVDVNATLWVGYNQPIGRVVFRTPLTISGAPASTSLYGPLPTAYLTLLVDAESVNGPPPQLSLSNQLLVQQCTAQDVVLDASRTGTHTVTLGGGVVLNGTLATPTVPALLGFDSVQCASATLLSCHAFNSTGGFSVSQQLVVGFGCSGVNAVTFTQLFVESGGSVVAGQPSAFSPLIWPAVLVQSGTVMGTLQLTSPSEVYITHTLANVTFAASGQLTSVSSVEVDVFGCVFASGATIGPYVTLSAFQTLSLGTALAPSGLLFAGLLLNDDIVVRLVLPPRNHDGAQPGALSVGQLQLSAGSILLVPDLGINDDQSVWVSITVTGPFSMGCTYLSLCTRVIVPQVYELHNVAIQSLLAQPLQWPVAQPPPQETGGSASLLLFGGSSVMVYGINSGAGVGAVYNITDVSNTSPSLTPSRLSLTGSGGQIIQMPVGAVLNLAVCTSGPNVAPLDLTFVHPSVPPNCAPTDLFTACRAVPPPCQGVMFTGNCTSGQNSAQCTCAAGYGGPNCAFPVNPCAANPCATGVPCVVTAQVPGGAGYQCKCPAGFYAPNVTTAQQCKACDAGKYNPVDPITDPTSVCILCAVGKFSDTGAPSCHACPAGYYGVEGARGCAPCREGQFSATSGQSSCQDCVTASSPSMCPAGSSAAYVPSTLPPSTQAAATYADPLATSINAQQQRVNAFHTDLAVGGVLALVGLVVCLTLLHACCRPTEPLPGTNGPTDAAWLPLSRCDALHALQNIKRNAVGGIATVCALFAGILLIVYASYDYAGVYATNARFSAELSRGQFVSQNQHLFLRVSLYGTTADACSPGRLNGSISGAACAGAPTTLTLEALADGTPGCALSWSCQQPRFAAGVMVLSINASADFSFARAIGLHVSAPHFDDSGLNMCDAVLLPPARDDHATPLFQGPNAAVIDFAVTRTLFLHSTDPQYTSNPQGMTVQLSGTTFAAYPAGRYPPVSFPNHNTPLGIAVRLTPVAGAQLYSETPLSSPVGLLAQILALVSGAVTGFAALLRVWDYLFAAQRKGGDDADASSRCARWCSALPQCCRACCSSMSCWPSPAGDDTPSASRFGSVQSSRGTGKATFAAGGVEDDAEAQRYAPLLDAAATPTPASASASADAAGGGAAFELLMVSDAGGADSPQPQQPAALFGSAGSQRSSSTVASSAVAPVSASADSNNS